MNINRQTIIVFSILLGACAGQSPPVVSTLEENTTTGIPSETPSSHPLPQISTTPESGVQPTPTVEDIIPITSETPIPNTAAGIMPASVSGASSLPTNQVKPDKFQDLDISVSGSGQFVIMPTSGFPPGVITRVNISSSDKLINPVLVVPALDVNIPIFGIALSNGTWDVSWMGNQAGWLEGSAYPTRNGNSVLTAHVVTADGKDGPFAHLKTLTPDDYVFIIDSGYRYIYRVDSIKYVKPNDMSAFSHEEDSWLTLVTCDSYDEETGTYLLRVVVRAHLIEIQEIK